MSCFQNFKEYFYMPFSTSMFAMSAIRALYPYSLSYHTYSCTVELKGVRGGVERRRGVCVGIETEGPWAERNIRRERKSLRNEVHNANAVVRGPA